MLQVLTLHKKKNCSCKPKVHFQICMLCQAARVELVSEILAITRRMSVE